MSAADPIDEKLAIIRAAGVNVVELSWSPRRFGNKGTLSEAVTALGTYKVFSHADGFAVMRGLEEIGSAETAKAGKALAQLHFTCEVMNLLIVTASS